MCDISLLPVFAIEDILRNSYASLISRYEWSCPFYPSLLMQAPGCYSPSSIPSKLCC